MRLKVCGITQLKQLKQLDALGVQMAGLIFYPESPRYVLRSGLTAEEVQDADLTIKKVGVFVNATEEEIFQQIKDFDLEMVQLHGNESPELCAELATYLPVIKAIRPQENANISASVMAYQDVVDYFLFDSGSAATGQFGGTGHAFNWEVLKELPLKKPFLLSGGIKPDDTQALKAFSKEIPKNKLWALDINSRFETEPGIKDLQKIEQFKNDLKS